jgi:chromosome partitioning protein
MAIELHPPSKENPAHVIVFCNEKGGSGKSTSAMHAAVALLRLGYKVGSIDLDARQGTFTRYFKNRFDFVTQTRQSIPSPLHMSIERSRADTKTDQTAEEKAFLDMALAELKPVCDFVVIDTPGTDSHLSRLAHFYADTLVTPLNDSFVDLDVLARIDPDSHAVINPSIYTQMVEEQNIERLENGLPPTHWIVMRNRLSPLSNKNKIEIGKLLERMSADFGFQLIPGFGERVVFRELFPKGLTLLDMKEEADHTLTMSEIAARQEVRVLIAAIAPEKIRGYIRPPRPAATQTA